jgi:hypothetical protein
MVLSERIRRNLQDNAAFDIAMGNAACLEPAIHAVRAAYAVLDFVRLAGFKRLPPCRNDGRDVIRMKFYRLFHRY